MMIHLTLNKHKPYEKFMDELYEKLFTPYCKDSGSEKPVYSIKEIFNE
eukprot:CAMPEP_0202963014 /NCGR_PEP_ID=MMETSP1396-20130829/7022_1 /ASSEMBLY_ACC=CAM_ASM_000872 /TAXON_ID= /ORGANISM="Pseudokeronopsis sp., Strain Brazil" /LENGTH=47 /DNA_ID= /DNA_START= /DNA_END= /DNA_ORIENTATION=